MSYITTFPFILVTGDCPPGKRTDDPQGRCCAFPFTYGGVSYDSCTTVANGNKPWCSFDSVYAGKWANCGNENIVCKKDSCMQTLIASRFDKENEKRKSFFLLIKRSVFNK